MTHCVVDKWKKVDVLVKSFSVYEIDYMRYVLSISYTLN
jgi:hypothetical protein